LPLLLKFTEMNLLCFIKSEREVELSELICQRLLAVTKSLFWREILFENQIGKIYKWKSLKLIKNSFQLRPLWFFRPNWKIFISNRIKYDAWVLCEPWFTGPQTLDVRIKFTITQETLFSQKIFPLLKNLPENKEEIHCFMLSRTFSDGKKWFE